MQRMRILMAVLALVLAPLSGAMAMSLGLATAHHHCTDAVHIDVADEGDHHAPNLDPFTCDQCHLVMAALPLTAVQITPVKLPVWRELPVTTAQAHPQLSLFRPPKA